MSLAILEPTAAGTSVDPDEYIQALMRWHFDAGTGSPYWLRRARVAGLGADEYARLVSTASGVPLAVVRASIQWVADVLRSQRQVFELAMPTGAVGDWRDGRTLAGAAVWARRGDVFAVHAAGNTPAVHGLWPEALALGFKVAVRPSTREPYTALRLVTALREAGFPGHTLTLLPTDHDTADAIIAEADRAIVYGGQEVVDSTRPTRGC